MSLTKSGDTSPKSDRYPKLPIEATDPAICGVLAAAPTAGMDTGAGGTAGGQDVDLMLLGGGLLLAAAGTGSVAVRRTPNRA